MTWSVWLKGLAAAAIGGAASGTVSAVSGGQLNQNTAIAAAIGALTTVLAYLTKSPLTTAQAGATPAAGVTPKAS